MVMTMTMAAMKLASVAAAAAAENDSYNSVLGYKMLVAAADDDSAVNYSRHGMQLHEKTQTMRITERVVRESVPVDIVFAPLQMMMLMMKMRPWLMNFAADVVRSGSVKY